MRLLRWWNDFVRFVVLSVSELTPASQRESNEGTLVRVCHCHIWESQEIFHHFFYPFTFETLISSSSWLIFLQRNIILHVRVYIYELRICLIFYFYKESIYLIYFTLWIIDTNTRGFLLHIVIWVNGVIL